MRRVAVHLLCVLALGPARGFGQQAAPSSASEPEGEPRDGFKLRLSGELKVHGRWSEDDRFPLAFPFPSEFVPVGQRNVALQTVAPGASLEVGRALVNLEVDMPRGIAGHVQVGFINLYDRNPTSTDHAVDVREAWLCFGT